MDSDLAQKQYLFPLALLLLACLLSPALLAKAASPGAAAAALQNPGVGAAVASPHTLSIKPSAIIVLVGEPQRLRLIDEKGNEIQNAKWSVSNLELLEIRNDGGTSVTGVKPGKAIVTATWNGQSAVARITVMAGEWTSAPIAANHPSAKPEDTARVRSPEEHSPIYLTPDEIGMVVGEMHPLRLIGDDGHPIRGASWSIDNPLAGKITPGDDALVQALQPGEFTVTASWGGFEAEAKVTVYPGSAIPQGKAKWSVHPRPGYKETQIKPAVPSASGADLLELEQDNCGRFLTRAFDPEGCQVWIVYSDPGNRHGNSESGTEHCTGAIQPMQLIPTFR
jgi:hypothetical protein